MGNKKITVTIDGPAGAGKSSVARATAERTGLSYLDTGALYRAVAWKLKRENIAPQEGEKIKKFLAGVKLAIKGAAILVNGEDVSKEIRTPETDKIVSSYAAAQEVRDALLGIQREQAENGLVADGRDMGTVVFPDAELKIFLTAEAEERARRRFKQRTERGESADYEEILKQVKERDNYDMTREIAPLRPAPGCIIIDSTSMTKEETTDAIAALVKRYTEQDKS